MSSILSQGPIWILSLVFLMGVVIAIHELGHYLAGRMFGAAVESFSFGFGKSFVERKDRRGTRWRINRFPLGGFVKFIGEQQAAGETGDPGKISDEIIGKPFPQLTVGQRSFIAIAGPLANFVLAVALFALILFANGKNIMTLNVTQIMDGAPAAEAGFEVGDTLLEVNGKIVEDPNDLLVPMRLGTGNTVDVKVERSGQLVDLTVVPVRQQVTTGVGSKAHMGWIGLGYAPSQLELRHYNPLTALFAGAADTWETSAITLKMLGRIITGKESIHNLAGPVGIGDVGRRVATQTLGAEQVPLGARVWAFTWAMTHICALVSIGIGLFNLLPLPVLDGGHLVFNAYEALTGKVMPERVVEYSLRFGLVLLLTMAVFVTYGDVIETGVFGTEGDAMP